jgi:hypothetical protein
VTFDVKDFPTPLRAWAEGDRTNADCIVVHGLGHSALGAPLRGLERLFARRPAIDGVDRRLRVPRSHPDSLTGVRNGEVGVVP